MCMEPAGGGIAWGHLWRLFPTLVFTILFFFFSLLYFAFSCVVQVLTILFQLSSSPLHFLSPVFHRNSILKWENIVPKCHNLTSPGRFSSFLLHLSRWLIQTKLWSWSVMSNSLQPQGLYPTRLLHPWNFPGKSLGVGCHFLLQGNLSDPGIEPGSPTLQADTLPVQLPEKPMN